MANVQTISPEALEETRKQMQGKDEQVQVVSDLKEASDGLFAVLRTLTFKNGILTEVGSPREKKILNMTDLLG